METLEAIHKRASLKLRLSPRAVEQEKIDKVLEAARVAPSARNTQPWRFIVVTDRAIIENLVSRAYTETGQMVKEAPVIIVACANPSDDQTRDGKEYYMFDVALAIENLILAATDLGLVTHIMIAVNEDELKKILGVPPEVRFVAATPLSYPAGDSYDKAAEEKLGERTRKVLQEFAYTNTWEGKP